MKKLLVLVLLAVSFATSAQQTEVMNLAGFKRLLATQNDKVLVVNFWATWCAPCIKELPYFEQLTARKVPGVEVVLVSMDLDLDPDQEKVKKFVARKKIQSRVIMLDEENPNLWIDQVEKAWSGALPATIVINQKTGQRKFVEKELHEGDLEKLIAEIEKE